MLAPAATPNAARSQDRRAPSEPAPSLEATGPSLQPDAMLATRSAARVMPERHECLRIRGPQLRSNEWPPLQPTKLQAWARRSVPPRSSSLAGRSVEHLDNLQSFIACAGFVRFIQLFDSPPRTGGATVAAPSCPNAPRGLRTMLRQRAAEKPVAWARARAFVGRQTCPVWNARSRCKPQCCEDAGPPRPMRSPAPLARPKSDRAPAPLTASGWPSRASRSASPERARRSGAAVRRPISHFIGWQVCRTLR